MQFSNFLWRYIGTHISHLCRQVQPFWMFSSFFTAILPGRVLTRFRFLPFPKNVSKNLYQNFRVERSIRNIYYLQVMRNLREAIRQKRPDLWKNKNRLLHHDNAPAHTSLLVRECLAKNNTIMPQPPCSPDLAPLLPRSNPPVTFSCPRNWRGKNRRRAKTRRSKKIVRNELKIQNGWTCRHKWGIWVPT